jgi:DNA-binding beta-propeller fold protein YncE
MTDAVATPDLLPAPPEAAPQDAAPPAPPATPQVEDAPPPDRRRRFLLLFLLFGLLALLITFALWYFIFRQPIPILPNLDLTNPPSYVSSTYGLSKPLGVAVSSDGSRIYVTQGGGDQSTVLIDRAGNHIAVLAPPADVSARATQLYVAIDPRSGDVYATDRTAGAIFRYAADGTYKDEFKPGAGITVWQPLAITFDADGTLYVSDVGGDFQKVHVFGPDGAWLRDLGSKDLLAFPNGIGIDKAGNVYVSDSNNGRLVVFDKAGTELGRIQRGAADGDLGLPRGVVVDGSGRVFVVDSTGQGVKLFRALQQGDTAPAYLARFGREGTVDGTFEFPNGIAIDGRGRLYVTDWNNDRLQLWSY